MQLNNLKRKTKNPKKKDVGRGGKRGKTSGRGHKGQGQHGSHGIRPQMRDIIKKFPKLRGHGKNRSESVFYRGPEAVVNVGLLSVFKAGDTVNPTTLQAHKLINVRFDKMPRVKILATGELTIKLNVEECEVSVTAKEKIEKAGGTVKPVTIAPIVVAMQEKSRVKTEAKAAKKTEKSKSKKTK